MDRLELFKKGSWIFVALSSLCISSMAWGSNYISTLEPSNAMPCEHIDPSAPAKRITRFQRHPDPIPSHFELVETDGVNENGTQRFKATLWNMTFIDFEDPSGAQFAYHASEAPPGKRSLVLLEIMGSVHSWNVTITEESGRVNCYEGRPQPM